MNTNSQNSSQRILSIDIVRGLTLLLMLFVNDLYMPGVPAWLGHTEMNYDGMGLADWVFPSFLFMVITLTCITKKIKVWLYTGRRKIIQRQKTYCIS